MSFGAQSHLYHVLLDCMEREEAQLSDQIVEADRACRAFPLLPDFHGRLGLLSEAAGDPVAIAELSRAMELYEMPADESGESSAFGMWAGEVSAARARLLLAAGDRAGAEAALADAFDAGTAHEAAVDIYAELHEDASPRQVLEGLCARIGTDAERLFYLYRTAEGSGRMPLARAVLDALRAETGRAPELPPIYAAVRGQLPEERAAYLTGLLAGDVRETAEILLCLERVHTPDGRHLYRRLRALLPDVLRAFWRYYDEPDAAVCPDTAEGYELVRDVFVRTADEAQAARVIRCAGAFGIEYIRKLADDFTAAERPAAALAALLFYEEAGGAADAAYLYETGRACIAAGKRDEGRVYLSRALVMELGSRKARELMELIQ